jgi:hypothetical protein
MWVVVRRKIGEKVEVRGDVGVSIFVCQCVVPSAKAACAAGRSNNKKVIT